MDPRFEKRITSEVVSSTCTRTRRIFKMSQPTLEGDDRAGRSEACGTFNRMCWSEIFVVSHTEISCGCLILTEGVSPVPVSILKHRIELSVCPQQSYMWLDITSPCIAHATQKANDMNSTPRKKKVRQEES